MREADSLRIELLGAFQVYVGTRRIAAADWQRKARRLVALLALAPDHRLHREEVIEALWPDDEIADAGNVLNRTIYTARHILEPDLAPGTSSAFVELRDDVLILTAPGRMWIDVDAFTSAATMARAARTTVTYQSALNLYQGELLPNDRYEDWAAGRRDHLRSLYLALLLEAARLYEERGQFDAAVQTLGTALAQDPTLEDAHMGLMRVYVLQGRQDAALRQYERLAETLHSELDATPTLASRRLREQIAAGHFPATPPAPPEPTSPHRNEAWPATLPLPVTSFVGRDRELSEVIGLLAATRLVTLTGVGGTGKTRLALQAAAAVHHAYPDGVHVAELAAVGDGSLVAQAVATALHIQEEPGRPIIDSLSEALQARRLLLVLDNCEHLRSACAVLAVALLSACHHLRLLTTSREPLGVGEEIVWPVPALGLPDSGQIVSAEQVPGYGAIELFVQRARTVQQRFAVNAQSAAAIVTICRRLEGLPLAIELAAARLRVLSVAEIAERLDDVFSLLPSQEDVNTPHHRTLHAAIEWSYALLAEPERALFRRLAMFAGGWFADAAESVCAGAGLKQSAILDGLDALAKCSLLVVEDHNGRARHRLLEPVRQFAAEQLSASGEASAMHRKHAEWCLALAKEAQPKLRGPDQARWLDRIALDVDNMREALRWAEATGETALVLDLCVALSEFWSTRGYLSEGLSYLTSALAGHTRGSVSSQAPRARALIMAGTYANRQGSYQEAARWYEQALVAFEELDDAQGQADALNGLGRVAHDQGDQGHARAFYEQSLALSRTCAYNRGVINSLNNLGIIAWGEKHYARATEMFRECLELSRNARNLRGVAGALSNLGMVAQAEDAFEQALALHQESLAIRKELGDRLGFAITLANLAEITQVQQDYSRARDLYLESIAICRDIGDTLGIAQRLERLAQIATAEGLHERAVRLCSAALSTRDALGAAMSTEERAAHDSILTAARAALQEHTFAAASALGRAFTVDEAMAEARKLETQVINAATGPAQAPRQRPVSHSLSHLEQEIAARIAAGSTNRQIAADLGIALRTVDTHVGKVLEKLGCTSRAQIAERLLHDDH